MARVEKTLARVASLAGIARAALLTSKTLCTAETTQQVANACRLLGTATKADTEMAATAALEAARSEIECIIVTPENYNELTEVYRLLCE